MVPPEQIHVRVIYALPDRQPQIEVTIEAGATVADAVVQSGLVERFAELQGQQLNCALFGRLVALTDRVENGDRVEILRPLLVDPKENRRQAAARARGMGSSRKS